MDQQDIKAANVQRVLAFLKALKTKLPQLERNIEQLEAAGRSAHLYQGRWPTQPLEQTIRPLTSADNEHGLASIAAWGRQVMTRLESLHKRIEPPSVEDLDWLRTRLRELSTLCEEERAEAEKAEQTRRQSLRRSLERLPGSFTWPAAPWA
jgi:hypothetical protein